MKALFCLLFVWGCSHELPLLFEPGEDAPRPPVAARYLALGDSYTIGESVDPAQRWPVQLAQALDLPPPTIIARTGWSVAQLDAAMDRVLLLDDYDLVTLLIGVNDQFRGGTIEAYRPAFRGMLARAIGLAGDPCRVVVLSIPDYGNTPFGQPRAEAIGAAIDAFNQVNREETERAGAEYVDITAISREADPALVAADGLHPSGAQYRRWMLEALPTAWAATRCQ
jgi:lysophospholipase L1-like esterase